MFAQIHPTDPLSLTSALQGVHPVSRDFVADPGELAVAVVQGEVLVEATQHIHLVEKLEKLVEEYNLGTLGVEAFFEALKALVATMEEEERRAARERLSEDELAIFDLLTKPGPKLTKVQEMAVKKVARELLEKLQEQLAIDQWQAKQQTRAAVQSTIRFTLNELPDEPYPEPLWNEKVDAVWGFVFARRQTRPLGLSNRSSG